MGEEDRNELIKLLRRMLAVNIFIIIVFLFLFVFLVMRLYSTDNLLWIIHLVLVSVGITLGVQNISGYKSLRK